VLIFQVSKKSIGPDHYRIV